MNNTEFYQNIEEPIREIVRALRDNGVNTTCSCGHKMYVQADILPDGMLYIIDRTLFDYLAENKLPTQYTIIIRRERDICGVTRCWADIQIGDLEGGTQN